MIQTKYLIILGVIICLIVLYYFYDEIKNVKKLFTPTYQKTMALEAKILELEKVTYNLTSKGIKNDSPALSITYQSDMAKKNGNLSIRYADLTETEANELLKNINGNKSKEVINTDPVKGQILNIQCEDLPEYNNKNVTLVKNNQNEDTDTINFRISDMIKKNKAESDTMEYQKILKGLSMNVLSNEKISDDVMEVDEDIIKHISESIQYADLPSEDIISDIPENRKSKNKKISKKMNQKKLSK